jgi:hypothetical protein
MLHFESSAFGTDPSETEHTNPDIFGRSLAEWVSARLRERGLPAGEVSPEDSCWCVPVQLAPHAVYVACASEEEMPGSWRWQLFVFAAVRPALESSPDIHNLSEEPA